MVKFVVMGIQRTGTILLCSSLNQHPDILNMDELFVNHLRYKPKIIPTYLQHLLETGEPQRPELLNHKQKIFDYLDHFYSLEKVRARGFKLMANQANRLTFVQNYLKKRKVRIIKIIRKNILKTYVSRQRSIKTGLYHSEQRRIAEKIPELASSKIVLPTAKLEKELEAIENENLQLDHLVKSINTESITIKYETLSTEFSSTLSQILSFLDVRNNIDIKPAKKKISPQNLQDSIENYSEVCDNLSGTRFAEFLK